MQAAGALSPGLATVPMPDDVRRQPMQNSPKFFGFVRALLFGDEPAQSFATPIEGVSLDPYTTPSSQQP